VGEVLQVLEAIRRALDLAGNVQAFVADNVQVVAAALRAFIFRTTNPVAPDSAFTTVGPIRSFTPLVQMASDSALTAVVTWAAFRMMWGRVTTRTQFVLRVMLPRVLLAAMLINFAVPLVQSAVDASNALSDSVMLATHDQILADARDFSAGDPLVGLQGVTMLVLFVSYAILAFAYVVRFALLVVLTILAPERQSAMVRALVDIYKHDGWLPDARSGTTMSENRIAASTPCLRIGCSVISVISSASKHAAIMVFLARSARYSGSDRPACRMNHTGTRLGLRPLAAAR